MTPPQHHNLDGIVFELSIGEQSAVLIRRIIAGSMWALAVVSCVQVLAGVIPSDLHPLGKALVISSTVSAFVMASAFAIWATWSAAMALPYWSLARASRPPQETLAWCVARVGCVAFPTTLGCMLCIATALLMGLL